LKWRQASSVLCDRRVPPKLKDKFYRTTICPVMWYGAECWPTKRRHVQQLSVAEMRMLRWFCRHTRRDRVRNEVIRERIGVASINEKLTQHQLRWFGDVQRRPSEAPVRSGVLKRGDKVKRGRGRPKLTWDESVKRDLKDWDISEEVALDRSVWRLAINVPESWSLCLLGFISSLPQLAWDKRLCCYCCCWILLIAQSVETRHKRPFLFNLLVQMEVHLYWLKSASAVTNF